MRQLKLAYVLPLSQIFVAAVLLEWDSLAGWRAPRGLIPLYLCYGMNAPVILVVFVTRLLDYALAWSLPFYFVDTLFLAGVAVLWHLVGRTIDRRRRDPSRVPGPVAWRVLLILLGIVLARSGIELARTGPRNRGGVGDLIGPALFLIWASALVVFAGLDIVKRIRQSCANTQ